MSMFESLLNTGSDEKFLGLTLGIVTNIDDPTGMARLKVRLLNRDTSNYETGFIRVMTPMSGKEWGTFFFPEVGDEVLVAFIDGDIYDPVVVGSFWNEKSKPVTQIKNKKNDLRMIQTKSGHVLSFSDEEGKETITLHTPKGLQLVLNDEKNKITVSDDKQKNVLEIDAAKGEITLKADSKMTLSAGNSKIVIDGKGNKISLETQNQIEIKSQQIRVDAKGPLDLKSASTININSNGPANIKGAIVKLN